MGSEAAPVRVLVVEDSERDAELALAELRRSGLDVEALRVDTETGLVAALDRSEWDLILSDFSMPGFGGLEALELVRRRGKDVPFVFVSGVLGEERAVEAMRAGARDYVLKDHLGRLGVAAKRELQEAADRRRRVEAEQALAAQERRYSRIFEMTSIALLELDLSALPALVAEVQPTSAPAELGAALRDHPALLEQLAAHAVVRDANDEAVRLFDAGTKAELVGPIGRAPSSGTKAGLVKTVEALAQGGRVQRELSLTTLTGRQVNVIVTARLPAHTEDLGRVVVGVLDMTNRRRLEELEEQMRAAQRMESIGQLAGGIAHDFNNLLTVIGNYAQFVLAKMPAGSDVAGDTEVIRDATERATALVRQLLTFRRREIRQLAVVDPNEIVSGLRKILERLVGADVGFVFDLAQGVKCVDVDPLHLEQVLMNLVVNARDAMPRGGRLTIETRDVVATDPKTATARSYVRLRVSDTGIGMDDATRARVFEPFFTTKAPGQGTGLGLSTVHGIIEHAGGFVTVESAKGAGTTFDVHLPASDGAHPRSLRRALGTNARGTETVLVVEDQDLVRRTTRRILESAGFTVLMASHAAEAIAVGAAHAGRIDCVLTDVVMPGMNILDAISEIHAAHPEARVLFTSGYAGDILSQRGITLDSVNYLPKPFTADALLRKVRDVLDDGAS